MSSRDSPNFLNAKSKTTSEVESAFFRAWSLRPSARSTRSSDTAQSSEVSPATSPARTPSAGTVLKAQRQAKRPKHQRLWSEPASKGLSDQGVSTAATPIGQPALLRTASTGSLGSESVHSQLSPSASPFRRLVQLSSHCIPPPAVKDAKPSLKAKDGFKWKLETSGHWVEFKIGRRSRADEPHKATEKIVRQAVLPTAAPPLITPVSPRVTVSPECYREPHTSISVTNPKNALAGNLQGLTRSAPETPEKQSVLSRWNKRRLGMKRGTGTHHQPELSQTRSLTGHLLQRASSVLRDLTEKKLSPPSSGSSNLSIAASYSRNAHLSPLYRGHSNTSSVGNMHLGKAPLGTPATPDSRLMYLGSDSEQYFRVEISEPGAPTYLPSEARRIGTPPLPTENGRHRGFFFDYNAPDDEGNTPSPETKDGDPRPRMKRKGLSDVDWYRVKLEADEARDAATNFELNVPDHLPNSPLCPKHPKHKSGGKGICVYHGRNRDFGDEA